MMWRLWGRRAPRTPSVPVPRSGREAAAREALSRTERRAAEADALYRRVDLLAAEVHRALGGRT